MYTVPLPNDPDDPSGQSIQYSIAGGNGSSRFTIAPSGSRNITVALSAVFDFESSTLSRFQVIIRATDNGGLSGTFVLDVLVLDDNDLPVVTSPAEFITPENVPQTLVLYNLTFVDVDAVDSHSCSIIGCSRPRCVTSYRMSSTTCRVYAAATLNYEDGESYISLQGFTLTQIPMSHAYRVMTVAPSLYNLTLAVTDKSGVTVTFNVTVTVSCC